jgi:hypothetical protein
MLDAGLVGCTGPAFVLLLPRTPPSMRKAVILVLVVYTGAYLALRFSRQEVWADDGQTYVIFPREAVWLHYLFRPLSYLDAVLTGMRFHIGPHD